MNKCIKCEAEIEEDHDFCSACEYKFFMGYQDSDDYINEHNLVDVGGHDFFDD